MNFRHLLDWIAGRLSEPNVMPGEPPRERRQFPRIGIKDCDAAMDGKGPFPITNISYGGIRTEIDDPVHVDCLKVGARITGDLRLQSLHLRLQLTVCNKVQNQVGCAFFGLTPNQAQVLTEFLKPQVLGASILEVSSPLMQSRDPNRKLRMFQGSDGTRILLWQSPDGAVLGEEFYFLDYVLSWNSDQKILRTGKVRDPNGKPRAARPDPETVEFFDIPSHRAMKIGKAILESAFLPPEARDQILEGIVKEERRLYNRFVLREKIDHAVFHSKHPYEGVFPVANLSLHGLAIVLTPEFSARKITRGNELTGTLEVGGPPLPARIKVIFRRGEIVGGNLEIQGEANQERLARYLAPKILGQSLEEIRLPLDEMPEEAQRTEKNLFLGLNNTHLVSVVDTEGNLVLGRMVFTDQVLVFDCGRLVAFKCPSGVIFPRDWELPAEFLEKLAEIPDITCFMAREILEGASLPERISSAWKRILPPPHHFSP